MASKSNGETAPPKLDPQLAEQLDRAAGEDLVDAILSLGGGEGGEISTDEAQGLLERVARQTGSRAERSNVLRHAGKMIVRAPARFVRALSEQPEVTAALPADRGQSAKIPPRNKQPAPRPAAPREVKKEGTPKKR